MNKDAYIREVNGLKASEELKNKIKSIEGTAPYPKQKSYYKPILAIAACFLVVIGIASIPFAGADKSHYDLAENIADDYYDKNESQDADGSSFKAAGSAERKLVKNADVSAQTKNYDVFMTAINQKINQRSGYVEASNESALSSTSGRFANLEIRLPAAQLDEFLKEIESLCTITSKQVSTSDITDSYIDTKSLITALETEEKTLLSLMEKAENLSEVIEIQGRLSQVRAELESHKAKLKAYDSQVDYSRINLNISEVERVTGNESGSFFSKLKESFLNGAYNLGKNLTNFAFFFFRCLPYLGLIAALGGVVLIIVKIKNRKK